MAHNGHLSNGQLLRDQVSCPCALPALLSEPNLRTFGKFDITNGTYSCSHVVWSAKSRSVFSHFVSETWSTIALHDNMRFSSTRITSQRLIYAVFSKSKRSKPSEGLYISNASPHPPSLPLVFVSSLLTNSIPVLLAPKIICTSCRRRDTSTQILTRRRCPSFSVWNWRRGGLLSIRPSLLICSSTLCRYAGVLVCARARVRFRPLSHRGEHEELFPSDFFTIDCKRQIMVMTDSAIELSVQLCW